MLGSFLECCTLQNLVLYTLANCILPWYAMWRNRAMKPDKERDIERFAPWVRLDYDEWNPFLVPFTHFFFLPRYCGLLTILVMAVTLTQIICMGSHVDRLGPTQKWLLVQMVCVFIVPFYMFFGYYSVTRNRPEVDYSKWLGPDWEPSYDGASILISNHTGFNEILNTFLFIRPMPGFIAKHGVKQVPSIGPLATSVGSVFMDRRNPESRKRTFDEILRNQQLAEKGEGHPLMIFPEGCNTNGKYLIKFKKGAFWNLKPVQPFINKTTGLRCKGEMGDVGNIWHWSFLIS